MDGISRKRSRLMLEPLLDNELPAISFATAHPIATTISEGGESSGGSLFLAHSTSGGLSTHDLSANLLLAICDGGSDFDDSSQQEYLINESDLALAETPPSIKHEQELPLQYRLINQHPRLHQLHSDDEPQQQQTIAATAHLPANMQLPSGCEIYLVKEYLESAPTLTLPPPLATNQSLPALTINANGNSKHSNNSSNSNKNNIVTMTIKREINVSPPPPSSSSSSVNTMSVELKELQTDISTIETVMAVADNETKNNDVPATGVMAFGKRSYLMDAYKKRDDKRRATHNEVERRRRDKINSWIFKLKEMLPTETPPSTDDNHKSNSKVVADPICQSGQRQIANQQQTQRKLLPGKLPCLNTKNSVGSNNNNSVGGGSNRTVPCDSKSQILIKACEYIKTMQDELKSLRECLAENERLRARNQRLETEVVKFKSAFAKINTNLKNCNSNNNNNDSKFSASLNGLISNQCVYNNNSNNNNLSVNKSNANSSINNNHNINDSAGPLEILPIDGDFESGFLLTPIGGGAYTTLPSNENLTSNGSSSSSRLCTTIRQTMTTMVPATLSVHFNGGDADGSDSTGFIKHELILNDLNV